MSAASTQCDTALYVRLDGDLTDPLYAKRSDTLDFSIEVDRLETFASWSGVYCDYQIYLNAYGLTGTGANQGIVLDGTSPAWTFTNESYTFHEDLDFTLEFDTDLARGPQVGMGPDPSPSLQVTVVATPLDNPQLTPPPNVSTRFVDIIPDDDQVASFGIGPSRVLWDHLGYGNYTPSNPPGPGPEPGDQCGVFSDERRNFEWQHFSGGAGTPSTTSFEGRLVQEYFDYLSDGCAALGIAAEQPGAGKRWNDRTTNEALGYNFVKTNCHDQGWRGMAVFNKNTGEPITYGFTFGQSEHPDESVRNPPVPGEVRNWYNDQPGIGFHDTLGYELDCMQMLVKLLDSSSSKSCTIQRTQHLLTDVGRLQEDEPPTWVDWVSHPLVMEYRVGLPNYFPNNGTEVSFTASRGGVGSTKVQLKPHYDLRCGAK